MTAIDTIDFVPNTLNAFQQDPYDYIELKRAHVEKFLNILGYIPVVCSASGITRGLYGIITIVSSCAAASFRMIADTLCRRDYQETKAKAVRHMVYIGHGIENVARACVECFPFVINNFFLVAYDLSMQRHEYPAEERERLARKV